MVKDIGIAGDRIIKLKIMIDRKNFYEQYRIYFGKLKQSQVDGLNFLLDYADTTNFSKTHIAYILATAYHETNETMQPVKEAYWIKPESARVWALRKYYRKHPTIVYPDGRLFAGRGYVQLTHDFNYKSAGEMIGVGDELFRNPEKALIPEYCKNSI